MVNDDPNAAQNIWKTTMSVTESCCCKELRTRERGDEKAETFVTGLLAATWVGPSMCSCAPICACTVSVQTSIE